ncbi:hypothetical protein Pfo_020791, partial [Paulownia fortunei]
MAVQHQQRPTDAIKSYLSEKVPSTSQVLAVVTLFPVGGILLCLAGLTLTGSLIGLAVATPLFVIFSPILVPAALTIALAEDEGQLAGAARARKAARGRHGGSYGPKGAGGGPKDPSCNATL